MSLKILHKMLEDMISDAPVVAFVVPWMTLGMKAGDTHKALEDNMALKGVYNVHREASLAFDVPVVAPAVPAVVHVEPVVDSQVY